jgi:hypothetical protein
MWKILSLASLFLLGALAADDCPVDREEKCVDDFQKVFPYCKKAAETKGADFDADINCLKYSTQM